MSAFTLEFDATQLFYRRFLIQPTSLGWLDSRQVQTVQLGAGQYAIQVQSGVYTDFWFTVTPEGTVDFDPAFDGFAGGRRFHQGRQAGDGLTKVRMYGCNLLLLNIPD